MLRTSSVVLMFVVLIALVAGGVYYFRDTEGPAVFLQPDKGPVSAHRELRLKVSDEGSGLRSLRVTALQDGTEFVLADRQFPHSLGEHQEGLSLAGLKLKSAPFELRVAAVDGSIYHFGQGTATTQSFILEFDSKPPVLSVRSRAHNLNQGGAGLIIYSSNEELTRTGVLMGERFFPAYRQPSGDYACLFSLPYDADAKTLTPKLIGEDLAGNERQTGFPYYAKVRQPPTAKINISDAFLQEKMPNFQHLFPETDDVLQIFLKVNRELRTSNRSKLLELGRQTRPEPLWQGAFSREPGANREPFGAVRSYYYQGKKIDQQTHLGIDLASVAQGPVHAENRGEVIFADDYGIYGQCVIIDHGLGLQSLYGHLSSIAVAVGDTVQSGQEIGRTGATGLAGGDHLHLGILVSGLPVNPVEWWDPNWVRNNITSKLELLREPR